MWWVTSPIFRASLSIGAEEDLGVPTKRNPARPFLFRKPNPATYGQMAISPYLAENLTILFPDWRRVQGRAFGVRSSPPFLNEFRRFPLTIRVSRFFFTCMSSATLIAELESVPEETRREVLDFLAFLKSRNAASSSSGESFLPLAQTAWAEDWSSPEEDEAWKDL